MATEALHILVSASRDTAAPPNGATYSQNPFRHFIERRAEAPAPARRNSTGAGATGVFQAVASEDSPARYRRGTVTASAASLAEAKIATRPEKNSLRNYDASPNSGIVTRVRFSGDLLRSSSGREGLSSHRRFARRPQLDRSATPAHAAPHLHGEEQPRPPKSRRAQPPDSSSQTARRSRFTSPQELEPQPTSSARANGPSHEARTIRSHPSHMESCSRGRRRTPRNPHASSQAQGARSLVEPSVRSAWNASGGLDSASATTPEAATSLPRVQ